MAEPDRALRLEASAPGDGPLHGLAVGVKDLYRVDGLPTAAGSRLPPDVFEGDESLVVTRLKGAGAVVLGKTELDEFAYCEPPPTVNPRDPRRTPGGSSGGSAAAVAAGICRFAIGSQTLQSIIVPAAYCGVVGYTSTFGRLRFDGIPLAPSMDTVGFLAPTVADLRTGVGALIPGWGEPASSSPVLGVLEPWGSPSLVSEAWRAYERHLGVLREYGCDLRDTSVPWIDADERRTWGARIGDLLHAEMALAHAPWFDRFSHLYGHPTAEAVWEGRKISGERLGECRDEAGVLAEMLRGCASRAGIDCWVCPSARGVAPLGYEDTGDSTMTGFWSYVGFPAVSLPVFDGVDGLPLGVQLVGLPGQDELLLGWAAHVESALRA